MTRTQTPEARTQTLKAVLRELPTDPDEIARLLGRHGIVGTPQTNARCPLAKYLTRMTGQSLRVIHNLFGRLMAVDPPVGVALPPAAAKFVKSFDEGAYPCLRCEEE